MIERYSRPEMKKVWSDENKYEKWLEVVPGLRLVSSRERPYPR